MAQHQSSNPSSSSNTLYPQFEQEIPPLDENQIYSDIIKIEKELVAQLNTLVGQSNLIEDVEDAYRILPIELISSAKRNPRPKVDPLKRINQIPTEETGEEEETEDEENEDEEIVADEEDDAGGDYIVSHFDNGEGFEDNDDDGDDITSVL